MRQCRWRLRVRMMAAYIYEGEAGMVQVEIVAAASGEVVQHNYRISTDQQALNKMRPCECRGAAKRQDACHD